MEIVDFGPVECQMVRVDIKRVGPFRVYMELPLEGLNTIKEVADALGEDYRDHLISIAFPGGYFHHRADKTKKRSRSSR